MSSLKHDINFHMYCSKGRIHAICARGNVSLSPQNCIIPSYRESGLNLSCTDWYIIHRDVLSARDWASRPSKTLVSCWERNQSGAASDVRFMCLHHFGGFSKFTVGCWSVESPSCKIASLMIHLEVCITTCASVVHEWIRVSNTIITWLVYNLIIHLRWPQLNNQEEAWQKLIIPTCTTSPAFHLKSTLAWY